MKFQAFREKGGKGKEMSMITNLDITTANGDKLKVKKKAFIDSFVECKNATQAVIEAGYKNKNPRVLINIEILRFPGNRREKCQAHYL